MQLGVVTTSYPRFPGDPAGNFVAAHVTALRALGHCVEVIAAGGPDSGEPGNATRGAVNRPASMGETGREGPPWIHARRIGGLGLFYAGGAPDALERSPLRAGLAAAAFTARLTALVAAAA